MSSHSKSNSTLPRKTQKEISKPHPKIIKRKEKEKSSSLDKISDNLSIKQILDIIANISSNSTINKRNIEYPFVIDYSKQEEKTFTSQHKSLKLSEIQLKNLFILAKNKEEDYIRNIKKIDEYLFYTYETNKFSFKKPKYDYEGIIFYLRDIPIELLSRDEIFYLSEIIRTFKPNNMVVALVIYYTRTPDEFRAIFSNPAIYTILYKSLPNLGKSTDVELFIQKMMLFWSPEFVHINYAVIEDNFWREKFGFNVIDLDLYNKIHNFIDEDSVLSIMSGNGLLEYLLKLKGVDITITSKVMDKWGIKPYSSSIEIQDFDYLDAIETYPTNVLMVSWIPPNMDVLNIFDTFNGNKLVILGEVNGSSATDEFYDKLFNEWECQQFDLNNFFGMNNSLLLCTYPKQKTEEEEEEKEEEEKEEEEKEEEEKHLFVIKKIPWSSYKKILQNK